MGTVDAEVSGYEELKISPTQIEAGDIYQGKVITYVEVFPARNPDGTQVQIVLVDYSYGDVGQFRGDGQILIKRKKG